MSELEKVIVEWVDSRQPIPNWIFKSEFEALPIPVCYTMGFVIEETKEYIIISQSVIPDQGDYQINGVTQIPIECIKSKRKIA